MIFPIVRKFSISWKFLLNCIHNKVGKKKVFSYLQFYLCRIYFIHNYFHTIRIVKMVISWTIRNNPITDIVKLRLYKNWLPCSSYTHVFFSHICFFYTLYTPINILLWIFDKIPFLYLKLCIEFWIDRDDNIHKKPKLLWVIICMGELREGL